MRRALAISFAGLAIFACSGFGSTDEDPSNDAGTEACVDTSSDDANCGACGARCAAGKTCVAGVCTPGCRGKIIYVSAERGSDASDGCTQATPMKTIGAAVAFASTQDLRAHEIHVCRGTYAERSLILSHATSLRGGYNCVSWTRAGVFGADGGFTDPNETIIRNADYAAAISTLDVAGAQIGHDVVVDGFTVEAVSAGDRSSDAMLVRDGASPLVADMKIIGGATTNVADVGSTGLQIRAGANPEVTRSTIAGGSGRAPVYGSIGVLLSGASASIHDNKISSGTGSGGFGAHGIIASAPPLPIVVTRNEITFAGSHSTEANGYAGIGISIAGVATVSYNRVLGGASTCDVGGCSTLAVHMGPSDGSRVVGNTIGAGSPFAKDGTRAVYTFGLSLSATKNALVAGNVIHAGGEAADASYVAGIAVEVGQGSSATTIVGNTLLFASGAGADARVGIRGLGNDSFANGPTNTTIAGNLFVGGLAVGDRGIQYLPCLGATLAALHDNVFVSVTYPGDLYTNPKCAQPSTLISDAAQMDTMFGGGSNDLAVRPSCANGCVQLTCTGPADCASHVFSAWDAPSGGAANLASGLRLASGIPCTIAQGNYDLTAEAAVDLYGTMRTKPFSIGAAEQDGTCAN